MAKKTLSELIDGVERVEAPKKPETPVKAGGYRPRPMPRKPSVLEVISKKYYDFLAIKPPGKDYEGWYTRRSREEFIVYPDRNRVSICAQCD